MQTKASTALHRYWMQQRNGRTAPQRKDIDPAALARILPDLFMLEHGAAADPGFRLAGTRLCAQFGRELKGERFDALFAPDQRNRVARIAENVMAHVAPALLEAQALDGAGDLTAVEIVLLPLAAGGGAVDRIIGAFAPLPGQRPPLAAMRMLGFTAFSAVKDDPCPAETPSPLSVLRLRAAGDRPGFARMLHLRVFEGGRGAERP